MEAKNNFREYLGKIVAVQTIVVNSLISIELFISNVNHK